MRAETERELALFNDGDLPNPEDEDRSDGLEDLLSIVRSVFSVWLDGAEVGWTEHTWAALARAGPCRHRDRLRVRGGQPSVLRFARAGRRRVSRGGPGPPGLLGASGTFASLGVSVDAVTQYPLTADAVSEAVNSDVTAAKLHAWRWLEDGLEDGMDIE